MPDALHVVWVAQHHKWQTRCFEMLGDVSTSFEMLVNISKLGCCVLRCGPGGLLSKAARGTWCRSVGLTGGPGAPTTTGLLSCRIRSVTCLRCLGRPTQRRARPRSRLRGSPVFANLRSLGLDPASTSHSAQGGAEHVCVERDLRAVARCTTRRRAVPVRRAVRPGQACLLITLPRTSSMSARWPVTSTWSPT